MERTDTTLTVSEGVALLTLDRPEHLNTFTGAMGREIDEAYRFCDGEDGVRAVVVTGAGRAFCAGADLTAGADTFAPQDRSDFSAAALEFPAWRVRKPVIAAVNGHAVGLGLTLALQCDIRIMAREGKYGVLQTRRGMVGDAYSHWTLPRIVGMARAADILLTGRTFRGDEAAELGVASRVVASEEVLPTAMEIAVEIAQNTAPLSVAMSKRLLWQSFAMSAEEVERAETELHHKLMLHPDAIEGPMAYLEKRKPKWSGSVARETSRHGDSNGDGKTKERS